MDLANLTFNVDFQGNTSAVSSMNGATNNLGTNAEKATTKLKNMGKSFAKIGRDLTKKITMPIVGLATAGTKMALDLETGLKKVTTLADKDILPIDKIKKEIRTISDASGIAQTEIAESVYSALSAGVDSSKVMDFARSSIDVTRAGFTDMDTVIDATTTVLNAYGAKAYDVSKIHDIFVQTQDKGKISVDELGKNIGRVIPTASSLGVNLNQLGASYAILTAKGQRAEMATTNLTAMLDEMGKTGSNVDKVLRQRTGKSFAQLSDEGKTMGEVLGIVDEGARKSGLSLKDMFSSTTAGSAAVTLLSDGVEGFNKSLADMDGATGKTAQNAKTMEDGWLKIKRATTQVKNALIEAGAAIAPYIEMGATKISELVGKFNALDGSTKKNILKFAGIAAAIGPLTLAIGKVIGVVGTVISIGAGLVSKMGVVVGFLGGPLTLAIGVAVGAGVLLYKNWDKVKEFGVKAWEGITNFIEGSVSKIKGHWEGLKTFMKNPIKGTINIFKKDNGAVTGIDGSHATGLAKVPFDNYVANLHKGEEVLTANDPRNQNNNKRITSPRSRNGLTVLFNPSYSIEIKGNATKENANDLAKQIDKQTRKTVQEMFYELGLQMS